MLDPFTALSLASAVVQFVDFGVNVVERAREIHRAGFDIETKRVRSHAKDVGSVAQNLDKRQRLLKIIPKGEDPNDLNGLNDLLNASSKPTTGLFGLYQDKEELKIKQAKKDLRDVNEALRLGDGAKRGEQAILDNDEKELRDGTQYLFSLNDSLKKREKPGLMRAGRLAEGEQVSCGPASDCEV